MSCHTGPPVSFAEELIGEKFIFSCQYACRYVNILPLNILTTRKYVESAYHGISLHLCRLWHLHNLSSLCLVLGEGEVLYFRHS